MTERAEFRWMTVGLLAFSFSTMVLCGNAMSVSIVTLQQGIPQDRSTFSSHVGAALFVPICILILCFTMDTLSIGLKRSAWSGWGALGLAAGCFMAQGVVLLTAVQYFAPLLVTLVGTPWLVRRAFSLSALSAQSVSSP